MGTKGKKKKRYRHDGYLTALGAHCRKLRQKKGVSVNRMSREAEQLSPSSILRLENATAPVNILTLLRYAEVLEVDVKKLLDFEYDIYRESSD
jgi:transcriptional regulator with XRE-family HTH domain